MLSDSERERMRLEESYRHEVRTQLAGSGPKSRRSAAWAFLNSSFALWLLSAVFITGAGALFTRYQENREEEASRRERIERLDLEISYRYSLVLGQLWDLTNGDVNNPVLAQGRTAADVERVMAWLNQRPSKDAGWLYPEFAAYELPGLLAELRRFLADEPDERQKVDAALAKVAGRVWTNTENPSIKGLAAVIQRLLMTDRWRQGYFYYIDCPVEQPFC